VLGKFTTKLFYSYCHADEMHKEKMHTSLSVLKRSKLLSEWHDRKIIAGQKISERILSEMTSSDIVVFLVSPDFLSSQACNDEWNLAKTMADKGSLKLISIILRDCAWKDFDDMANYLVLPKDGKPLDLWDNVDTAWKNVYEGIKSVIEDIQKTFTVKSDFQNSISSIEFCSLSEEPISLDEIFVFPQLYTYSKDGDHEQTIGNSDDLLKLGHVLIRGEDQSGKTKLCSHLFLDRSKNDKPVLFIDLEEVKSKKPSVDIFSQKYAEQFYGDFELWRSQENKTIIFDNLTHNGNSLRLIEFASEVFENILVTTSNDSYTSYFKDELTLTNFSTVRLGSFTHSKQEQLIKKWLGLRKKVNTGDSELEDGQIDQIERNINGIIINDKILPRYPFFILSILQTYEVFMPQDLRITAYGHCYHALILAHLIKSGVDRKDESINPCLNFASHLAFEINKLSADQFDISTVDYDAFVTDYKSRYIISESLLNRMTAPNGILKINKDGHHCFSLPYSYYFFLGRYLATFHGENEGLITNMIEKSYLKKNTLSLIFAIHHAQDIEIIDEILLHTSCTVDVAEPSKLDTKETLIFQELMSSIPHKIISDRSVDEERLAERNVLDKKERIESQKDLKESSVDLVNQIYQTQKNIEILSHILKNKTGVLKKDKIREIIEIICDAGLRLISVILCDENGFNELTKYVNKQFEESPNFNKSRPRREQVKEVEKFVRYAIFVWTMVNIEKIVSSLSKPDLRELIKNLRDEKNTPAYDIIYYFYSLNVADSFDENLKNSLKNLVAKYDKKEMSFLHRVLSLRTQHYINTHRIKAIIKQSTSSILEIDYHP
jgi:hypothetical protein